MTEQPAPVEMVVPALEVEELIARTCAAWGVDRSEVAVESEPAGGEAGDQVRVRITPLARLDEALELRVAQQTLEDLLDKMKIGAEVHAAWGPLDAETAVRPILLDVRGDDLSLLIGRRGETLGALQYITRLIASKELGRGLHILVDVEGYRHRREEQLRRMARRMADQAVQRQLTLALEPMPASERRIIHLELRDRQDVRTESVGEGDHRKVTIIPTNLS